MSSSVGSWRALCGAVAFVASLGCAGLQNGARQLLGQPPIAEVPESVWVTVDGVSWATNGHVIVRRDGAPPPLSPVHEQWRDDVNSEQMAHVLELPSPTTTLEPVDTVLDGTVEVARWRRDAEGSLVHLDAAYATLLTGEVVQGLGPMTPVYTVDAAGEVQAVVMPRLAPD